MNRRNFKKKGFSLAEITVTLMIIGVIAALTLPQLIQSTRQKEYYTGYKKAFSVGSQALERQISDYNYATIASRNGSSNGTKTQENFKEFSKYFNVAKECFNSNNSECWNPDGEKLYSNSRPGSSELAFVDASGMAWSLYANSENIWLTDINGYKGPNEYGKDRWYFVPVNSGGFREGAGKSIDEEGNVVVGSGANGKAVGLAPYNALNDSSGSAVSDITSYSPSWCQHPPCKIKTALEE